MGKSILLIEKDYSLLSVFKRILERDGYTVLSAENITFARGMMTQLIPDLIILEHEFSDGDGIEYCRELRSLYSGPILFQSWTVDDKDAAQTAGADEFMKIPFDIGEARARIRSMLGGSKRIIAVS